jgi:phosphatidate cytidylyltransferase
VYLIVLVALADTGAYFVGRYLGRRALAPNISPGKTREGLLGGVATVLLYATLVAGVWGLAALDGVAFVLLSIVVALVSVTGDLFESILKRRAGAKDSGSLLPGHGGILDRFDSLVAAAPVFLAGLLWLALIPRVPGTAA